MHIPVLLKETVEFLNPQPGDFIVDGTVDGGGHSSEIFKKITPGGILLGIDKDKNMIEIAKQNILKNHFNMDTRLILVEGNYACLDEILEKQKLGKPKGLLLDLGFSSWHIKESKRGFSFQKDEPLVMTYGEDAISAEEFLNNADFNTLYKIIKTYGQEKYAYRIAKKIIERRRKEKIATTTQLVEIIKEAVPLSYLYKKIHPATKTFQALRIYLNQELQNLELILQKLPKILKPKGRVVIISYHSLEDKLVKNYFRNFNRAKQLQILTKKPVIPTQKEIKDNPKSRSAKLRAAIIL